MGKLYFKNSSKEEKINQKPSKETVQFLLSYSQALSVIECQKMKFEMLLN
ncbi:hypothetical protein [Christiangramia fulva]|nr:hypothetical protein [Christiangramia fulva]